MRTNPLLGIIIGGGAIVARVAGPRFAAFRNARAARKAASAKKEAGGLRRWLFGGATVTGAGGAAFLGSAAFNTLKSISSAFANFLGKGEDQDLEQKASVLEPISQIASDQETPQFERINVADLFSDVSVDKVDIVPELGPETDRYEKHLNLIIERVASLESEVATQNNLINKLRGGTEEVFDQNRKTELAEKRRRSEDDIEQGYVRRKLGSVVDSVKSGVSDITGAAKKVGKAAAGIAGLFLASGILKAYADGDIGKGETTLRERFIDFWSNRYLGEKDEFDELEEIEEVSLTDTIENIVRQTASDTMALTGALRGSGIRERFAGMRADWARAGGAAATRGQFVEYANRAGITRSAEVIRQLPNGMVQVRPPGGGAPYAIAGDQITKRVAPPPGARPTTSATGGVSPGTGTSPNAQQAGIFRRNINKFLAGVRLFLSKTNETIAGIRNIISKVTSPIGRILGFALRNFTKIILTAYALFEAIDLIKRNTQMFGDGEMTEEEYHDGNKRQINRIIGEIGLPFIFGTFFAMKGTALGTAIPIIGNIVGAGVGLAIGVAAGMMADYFYRLLMADKLVNAIYDFIFVDDESLFRQMLSKISDLIDTIKDSKAGRAAEAVLKYNPVALQYQAGRAIGTAIRNRFTRGETSIPSESITSFDEVENITLEEYKLLYAEEMARREAERLNIPSLSSEMIQKMADDMTMEGDYPEGRYVVRLKGKFVRGNIYLTTEESEKLNAFINHDNIFAPNGIQGEETTEWLKVNVIGAREVLTNVQIRTDTAREELIQRYSAMSADERKEWDNMQHQYLIEVGENPESYVPPEIIENNSESFVTNNELANINNSESFVTNNELAFTNQGNRVAIVPIMQPPQPRMNMTTSMPDMGSGFKTPIESASPTYNTSDSFLDLGLVT